MSGALLLLVGIGFSRSFYLRAAFTDRPLPAYLWAHGVALTLWFGLAFLQSLLVATRRTALHMRLGILGAINAALLVPLSALVTVRAIPRYLDAGVAPEEIQFIVLGDLISLVVFSGFVVCGIVRRRQREWHRRLMAMASIMIVGPAVARLAQLGLAIPVPAVLLALLLALGINDKIEIGRLHRATVVCASVMFVSLGALFLLVGTPQAEQAIAWLNPRG